MNSRIVGCMLMVIGTSIGGGMLVLPSATALGGFYKSILFLTLAWLVMLIGALYIAEVNSWFHRDNNLVSMAKHTLGKVGQVVAWVTYLGLLYSLTSAYISGGSGVTQSLFQLIHFKLPNYLSVILFTIILAAIVWMGVKSVDRVNGLLMIVKFIALAGVILLILPHAHLAQLPQGHALKLITQVSVIITSFSFAGSVPTFCSYLDYDMRAARIAIIGGSFITLLCYYIWVATIQGAVSVGTLHGILSGNTAMELTSVLSKIANSGVISTFVHLFTSVCMVTAFINVSLGLADFLADGMGVNKQDHQLLVYGVTFIPPVCIALFFPAVFVTALSYAGIFCLILLMLLPALMAWFGRYHRDGVASSIHVFGGRPLLLIEIVLAVTLIVITILQKI
jgi:tyrosine-specific transport protein